MKQQLKPYKVRFERINKKTNEKEVLEKMVEATCPGGAFRQIHRKYPASKLLGAYIKGKIFGHELWINYEVPSLIKVEPIKVDKLSQSEMVLDDERKAPF
jgi:hypothetical protein